MLLSLVSNVIDYIKGVDTRAVLTFITGWGLIAIAIASTYGRIKNALNKNETNTKHTVDEIKNETSKKVDEINTTMTLGFEEIMGVLNELKERDAEIDAKLTKIMKKDPISKYKYGEVAKYVPEVTTYVAQPTIEEQKVEVENTPLQNDTPLPKKKRKARTSFVD